MDKFVILQKPTLMSNTNILFFRLSGLENTLFGFTSRIHPVIWNIARTDPSAVDIICFGKLL